MNIAFVGMGKLGFPCALAAADRGNDVVGYDVSPQAREILESRKYPHREEGAQALLEETSLRIVDRVDDAVEHADIVFVAVQTPHRPEFEGLTCMPEERADFDYAALRQAVSAVAEAAERQRKHVTVVVISTALPGTCRREVYPLLNDYTGFVYNPFFIAMGTTIADYLNPEFVLLGWDRELPANQRFNSLERVREFYRELHGRSSISLEEAIRRAAESAKQDVPLVSVHLRLGGTPHAVMSVPSAELTKVAYNVFLGVKIVSANSVMEIAHKVGADVDDVTRALSLAVDRVASAKYMRGGMGDGGGCHPRDQIALSWLAREHDLSYDLFGSMILAREAQTEWLAELCVDAAVARGREDRPLPVVVLGRAYKRGTNLTLGSPAILLKNILDEYAPSGLRVDQWDPHVDAPREFDERAVFVVGTDHDEFFRMLFPAGSVVIDPWGKMPDISGVEVVRVGRQGPRTAEAAGAQPGA